MSRLLVAALALLGLGFVLRRRGKSGDHVEVVKEELTLEQLFRGVVPENVKRTWTSNNKEKEDG